MRLPDGARRAPAHLADLLLLQLTNWRWSWGQLVLTGLITPVATMLALSTVAGDASRTVSQQILVGVLILGLLFQNLNQVAANFSFMKANGTLDFFAAQPVSQVLLVVATVGAFFLLSLPALLVIGVAGAVFLRTGLSLSPWLLLVVPLCVLSAAGIGALVGSLTSSIEESNSAGLVLTLLMTGIGPVMVPADRLPAVVNAAGRFNPATYAASALQMSMIGPVRIRLAADLAVLALFAGGVLLLVVKKMPWRMRP
jgi:ABC-2 type transport system permease protein